MPVSGGVSNPAPLPSLNLLIDWLLTCPLPQLLVCYFLRPSDVEDAPETGVEECLDLAKCGFSHTPCFCPIQQHRLDVCIENPHLGGHADFLRGAYILKHDEGGPCFACPCFDILVRTPLPVHQAPKVDK